MSLKTDYSQVVVMGFYVSSLSNGPANKVLKTRLNLIKNPVSGGYYNLNTSGNIVESTSSDKTWYITTYRYDSTDIDIDDYVEGYLLHMTNYPGGSGTMWSKLAIEFKKPVLLFPYLSSPQSHFGQFSVSPASLTNTLYIAEYDDISMPNVSVTNAGYICYQIPVFVNKGTRMSLTGYNYNNSTTGYGSTGLGLTFVPLA